MTQDEIIEMARQTGWHDALLDVSFVLPMLEAFAKLVAVKAIAELESQEPVAWVAEDVCKGQVINGRPRKIWWECEKGVGKPIYTHPPQPEQKISADDFFKTIADRNPKPFPPSQRAWVGLTDDDEILVISNTMPYADRFEFARAIEAKLKEKNND